MSRGHFRPYRETVAIVGDGQTERIYFANVRDSDRPDNLAIFPDYPRKLGSYTGVLERAIQITGDYNRVYGLIDLDKIHQDQKYQQYLQDKHFAEEAGVIVLENNPCFEMWLLLHFVYTGKLFTDCDDMVAELRKAGRIPGYEKSEKFQVSAKLYGNYREQLVNNAIPNAAKLEAGREYQDNLYPRAEVFKFFDWYLNR